MGWSLKETILHSDQSQITKTNIAQPYIFAISYCYGLEAFKKLGIPKVGIGHSLGEYTALALAEFISYRDALKIISKGINTFMEKDKAIILITHYQRLLDYIKPDFVHVLMNGRIIKSGGPELAEELEKKGYESFN